MNSPPPKQAPRNVRQEPSSGRNAPAATATSGKNNPTQVVPNKNYDEALEFSQSGSDESIDTQTGRGQLGSKPVAQVSMDVKSSHPSTIPSTAGSFAMNQQKSNAQPPRKVRQFPLSLSLFVTVVYGRVPQMKTKVLPVAVKKVMLKETKKRVMIILKELITQKIISTLMSPLKSKIFSNTLRDTNLTKSN